MPDCAKKQEATQLVFSFWLPSFLTALLLVAGIHEFKHRDELFLRYEAQLQLNGLLIRHRQAQLEYTDMLEQLIAVYELALAQQAGKQLAVVP